MRPKKTHAEPIQHVFDGDRQGVLYRWNTGETQVMWLSAEDLKVWTGKQREMDLQDN